VALRLVRALEGGGERAAALRAAEAHVLLLRQEVGVGPDAELAALMEELRSEPPAPPARPPRAPVQRAEAADSIDVDALADPEALAGSPGAPVPSERGDETLAEGEVVAVARVPARRRRLGGRVAVAAVGVVAAVLGIVAVLGVVALASGRGRGPEPAYDPRRIAVLYLDDDSPSGDLQYLANGLTEMLIHELSQVEALDVVSRNGVKPYRQGTVPFDSMVAQLRVGSVVEGSVARSADSVRVVVQLIDAATHSHLESRVVVRPAGDLIEVQRAVSQEVSDFLRRRLGAQVRLRQAERETRSPQALELVLRGEQALADASALRRSTDSADVASAVRKLEEADALLSRAEAADSRWARPMVARAWVAVQTVALTAGGPQEAAVDSALARAQRALAREPGNARALEVRGVAAYSGALIPGAEGGPLLERAERDLRAAVQAEPSLASAWGKLSLVLYTLGRNAESALAAQRALQEDAWLEDAAELLNQRYYAAVQVEDYAAAGETCERARRAFPRDWRFVECRLTLMRLDARRPQDAELAWRLVAQLETMDPPATAAAAGRAYAPVYRRMAAAAVSVRAGDASRARAELARARVDAAADPESRISLAYDEAFVLLLLGDREAARER
ncbi:MAG TPA: hypothetical protein VGX50_15320, partial [Longimicrobium sp.]|nr:hypothetical protein [Longimicrobium sp.]